MSEFSNIVVKIQIVIPFVFEPLAQQEQRAEEKEGGPRRQRSSRGKGLLQVLFGFVSFALLVSQRHTAENQAGQDRT